MKMYQSCLSNQTACNAMAGIDDFWKANQNYGHNGDKIRSNGSGRLSRRNKHHLPASRVLAVRPRQPIQSWQSTGGIKKGPSEKYLVWLVQKHWRNFRVSSRFYAKKHGGNIKVSIVTEIPGCWDQTVCRDAENRSNESTTWHRKRGTNACLVAGFLACPCYTETPEEIKQKFAVFPILKNTIVSRVDWRTRERERRTTRKIANLH